MEGVVLENRYHLPHNSIRVDEFNFMLKALDLNKDYYLYDDLRWIFLCEEVKADCFKIFHRTTHKNLLNHQDVFVKDCYQRLIKEPNEQNAKRLFNVQYSGAKKFKAIWNEYVRDYTEFFAFLGLLPSYYKGLRGDSGKKHYVSNLLKEFVSEKVTFDDLLLNFKYRNSSKNDNSFEMYAIEVRPFYVAARALMHFRNKGFKEVDPHILSSIVVFSTKEYEVDDICDLFEDPTVKLSKYLRLFNIEQESIEHFLKEIGRVTLFLKPYLKALNYISIATKDRRDVYRINITDALLSKFPKQSVFCNSFVGNLKLTPILGKVINYCYKFSDIKETVTVEKSLIFDRHITEDDEKTIIEQLKNLKIFVNEDRNTLRLNTRANQLAINPYTDFFTIDDANYAAAVEDITIENDSDIITTEVIPFEHDLENLQEIAYGSDGVLYENALFKIINNNFPIFTNKVHYGAAATGQRVSDIAFIAKIFDKNKEKKILIIIECKAGGAIRNFDERKEIDDVKNLLKKFSETELDGVWYWVVNGNALPSTDHGGYRDNEYSKNLLQKLNDIQFEVGEFSRMPTIVTAFSFVALRDYLKYLFVKTKDKDIITPFIIPHFWRWSKKFMNLQYVMIHKELNMGV